MPKYGIHHIVLKESVNKLEALGATEAADIIRNEMPYAIMGSIGPDIFFWGPDYEAVDKLYAFYSNIKCVIAKLNEVIQPVKDCIDAVGEPVEDLVETLAPQTIALIRDTLEQIQLTSERFKAALSTGVFAGVIDGVNLLTDIADVAPLSQEFFQLFVPGVQNNRPESEWYWFDMLHYRKTGKFAEYLVSNATTNRQKAFAYGYLSHIATDLTGHPFVNQIVGTPYRMNVWRHVTAENFMDTWKFDDYYNENINETLFNRLDLPDRLPSDVRDLLYNAFIQTYPVVHPERLDGDGFYTREDIERTYEIFYEVLTLLEDQYVNPPEEPFSGVGAILSDALDAFTAPPEAPSPSQTCSFVDIFSFGLTESSEECYDEFFRETERWLNYMGELLEWCFDSLLSLIDLLQTLLLSLPISVLLAILYGIQLLSYEIYSNARRVLSLNGYVLPQPSEMNSSVARNLTTPSHCFVSNFKYPSIGKPIQNNLNCPVSNYEQPTTAVGYHPADINSTPNRFINQEIFNEQSIRMYALAGSPSDTRNIHVEHRTIGNATDLTAWMIKNANDPGISDETRQVLFANWNLDSDRGYAYLTWKGTIPNSDPYEVENEEYQ